MEKKPDKVINHGQKRIASGEEGVAEAKLDCSFIPALCDEGETCGRMKDREIRGFLFSKYRGRAVKKLEKSGGGFAKSTVFLPRGKSPQKGGRYMPNVIRKIEWKEVAIPVTEKIGGRPTSRHILLGEEEERVSKAIS